MYQWLFVSILAAGLSAYNIYQAFTVKQGLYIVVGLFWLFAAVKQYKKYKNSKNSA